MTKRDELEKAISYFTDVVEDVIACGTQTWCSGLKAVVMTLAEFALERDERLAVLEDWYNAVHGEQMRDVLCEAEQPKARRLKDGYEAIVYDEHGTEVGPVGSPEVVERCYEDIPPAPGEPTNVVCSAAPNTETRRGVPERIGDKTCFDVGCISCRNHTCLETRPCARQLPRPIQESGEGRTTGTRESRSTEGGVGKPASIMEDASTGCDIASPAAAPDGDDSWKCATCGRQLGPDDRVMIERGTNKIYCPMGCAPKRDPAQEDEE